MVNGLPGAMGKEVAAACLRRSVSQALDQATTHDRRDLIIHHPPLLSIIIILSYPLSSS